ncbi:hypothetical protein HY489_00540 [Candidatus Woesearchaeota archaeon]|nr:hypothetical protein [Candidatus Woesearchaeota archaeon]
MAKKMDSMMCSTAQCGPKCLVLGVISAILAAGGLWLLVGGIKMQWSMLPWKSVLLWYTGGFLLWCIAKCAKMKACPMCAR